MHRLPRFFFLMCLILASNLASGASRIVFPDHMMPRTAWSFAEPVPSSTEELMTKLREYAKSIKSRLNERELRRTFPGKRLDIQYSYGVQRPDGQWDTIDVTVRVEQRGKPLAFAEILFQLHQASYKHLKDENHHFFEGLYLLDRQLEPGVPAYEVYLGS